MRFFHLSLLATVLLATVLLGPIPASASVDSTQNDIINHRHSIGSCEPEEGGTFSIRWTFDAESSGNQATLTTTRGESYTGILTSASGDHRNGSITFRMNIDDSIQTDLRITRLDGFTRVDQSGWRILEDGTRELLGDGGAQYPNCAITTR